MNTVLDILNSVFNNDNIESNVYHKNTELNDETINEIMKHIEEIKKYEKDIENLKDNPFASLLISMFNIDDLLNNVDSFESAINQYKNQHKANKVDDKKEKAAAAPVKIEHDKSVTYEQPKVNACAICEKEYCDDCEYFEDVDDISKVENEIKIERPSEKISTELGLQVHKLVQEYIDTMVKPYNPKVGGLTTKQINDAYAGLYEFACWILNK